MIISKVVGKLLIGFWIEVKMAKQVKISSTLKVLFIYWYNPIELTLIAIGASHNKV
jgi:hypothetical protein